MKKHRILLRASYWVAAVADFIIAILVLIPERMGVAGFVYPMGLMSAVAFSWGVLLLLADREPIERKWVLLPTILVVFLLGVAGAYAAIINLIPFSRIISSSAAVVIVLCLLIYTYFKTRAAWGRSMHSNGRIRIVPGVHKRLAADGRERPAPGSLASLGRP